MPDQTVQVSFTAPDQWTFDRPLVTMTAAGKIVLHRNPGHADWEFVTATVAGNGQFHVSVNPNGSRLTITDDHATLGTFPYAVTVRENGVEYTSGAGHSAPTLAAEPPRVINADPIRVESYA